MEKWIQLAKRADFREIGARLGISPILARLMVNRDVRDPEAQYKYLYGTLEDMYTPLTMKDVYKAADLLESYIAGGKKIAIASDFDADGIFSSYILYLAFAYLGGKPKIYTPDRVKEGYGLNERIVHEAFDDGAGIIVTCDNGIAAFEPIHLAKSMGMKVVVTDHHDVPYEELENGERRILYTEADAVVNPKQESCQYPFKKLCGAGVAYKLIQVLYEKHHVATEVLYQLIPYVAIATVTDVMDLEDENRIIVKHGLKMLACTENVGLQKLMQVTGIQPESINAYHIGFVLGPCFNAAGRLDTVKLALDLLMATDDTVALKLAQELKNMNESRKEMTEYGKQQAFEIIENSSIKNDKIKLVLLDNCHESLVGIIAGKVKERYNCPAIVFTKVANGLIKGSARSIEAYNIFEGLSRCKHLLLKFGGHPMAAGMTLAYEHLDELRRLLNTQTTLTDEDLIPVVKIDIPLPIGYISYELIDELAALEPYGKGNVKPVFAEKYLKVLDARVLGKNRVGVRMTLRNDDHSTMQAVYFGDVDAFDAYVESIYGKTQKERMYAGRANDVELAMTYYPGINEYMGNKNLQLNITGYCKIAR